MTKGDDQKPSLDLSVIADLTEEFLTILLRQNWSIPTDFQGVRSVLIERVNQGVLSQVYRVHVKYDLGGDASDNLPTQWVVKLPHKDFSIEWMFRSEKVFYDTFAPILMKADLPFTVPRLLLATENCLVLEGIPDMTCHELISGTPIEKLDFVTLALASLHGLSWKSHQLFESQTKNLTTPPGMGQRLHPLQKEYLFTQQWRDTVNDIQLQDPSVLEFIIDLCETMECKRLRDIHDMVHRDQFTIVHGDFHIANFLFPNDESKKPLLVDWATFGFGNPMTDLAFFLILNDCVASTVEEWLHKYYDYLIQCNAEIRTVLSFESVLEKFRWALLCQWMILVAYDKMSRQLVEGGEDEKKIESTLTHFRNVNRRAVIAMHSIGDLAKIIKMVPVVTEKEQIEAREFSANTPLSI